MRRGSERILDEFYPQVKRPRLEPIFTRNTDYTPGKNC